jgi:hypothetical protein
MKLWTSGLSRSMVHSGQGDAVVALLTGDGCTATMVLRCSLQLHRENEEVGAVLTAGSGGGRWWIQAGSSGEWQWPWMLVEVGFPSEKEGKWKRESGVVEVGQVWVPFVGPEQWGDVEARRWFGSRQQWALQCTCYGTGGELGGGETEDTGCCEKGKRRRRVHLGSDAARCNGSWPAIWR